MVLSKKSFQIFLIQKFYLANQLLVLRSTDNNQDKEHNTWYIIHKLITVWLISFFARVPIFVNEFRAKRKFLFYFASRILITMNFWAIMKKLWFYQRNLFRYFLSRSFILLSGCLFYEAPIRIRIKYIIRNTKCMGINLFKCEAFSFLA